jgi:hypothetical protein
MPELTQLAICIGAAFLIAITPGPGIFYVAARTLAGGRAEGIASSFGTGLGGMAHVLAGSFGCQPSYLPARNCLRLSSCSGPPTSSGSASAPSSPRAENLRTHSLV